MTSAEEKIFIVDDDLRILESLAWLVGSMGYPSETFSSAQEFLTRYNPRQPGCLLLDARMPRISGPELQQNLKDAKCILPIIFISGVDDVALAVRVMKAGAIDFIVKPISEQQLLEAINKAINIDKRNRVQQNMLHESIRKFENLSKREREILLAIYAGKSNKIIAYEHNLSLKTVEFHRASMMRKMKLKSVSQLVHAVVAINNEGLLKL